MSKRAVLWSHLLPIADAVGEFLYFARRYDEAIAQHSPGINPAVEAGHSHRRTSGGKAEFTWGVTFETKPLRLKLTTYG